jgi:hypothetical protein
MRFKVSFVALILWFAPVTLGLFAQSASDAETRNRDLANMFYTDTVPPPPTPKPVEPKAKPQNPKPKPKVTERRMGVKYGILLRTPDCDVEEVDASHTFVSGDKIRLQFEANVDGYLYVVQKGSSGSGTVLFPDSRINSGDNHVTRGIRYSVPPRPWSISFDQNPGEELLTVILSKSPLKSIPQQAQSSNEGSVSVTSVIDELNRQSVRSRDLILFKEPAPAVTNHAQPISAQTTQTTIVVNNSQEQNHTVYTEIRLKHK